MNLKKIKSAIISVSDKSNLKQILPILKKFNVKIISSGGTCKKIRSINYKCTEVSNYTGFSEMLGGTVKTLHPKIHAGILNIRKNKKHKNELKKKNIQSILSFSITAASKFTAASFMAHSGNRNDAIQKKDA